MKKGKGNGGDGVGRWRRNPRGFAGNGSNNLQNLSKEKENSKKSKMLSVKEEKII